MSCAAHVATANSRRYFTAVLYFLGNYEWLAVVAPRMAAIDLLAQPFEVAQVLVVTVLDSLELRPFARRDDADLDAYPAEDAGGAEAALERWRLAERVHLAIAGLDRPLREVLVLRDLEGLSGEETCRALGLALPAMKTRLHRARARVRAALGDDPAA